MTNTPIEDSYQTFVKETEHPDNCLSKAIFLAGWAAAVAELVNAHRKEGDIGLYTIAAKAASEGMEMSATHFNTKKGCHNGE